MLAALPDRSDDSDGYGSDPANKPRKRPVGAIKKTKSSAKVTSGHSGPRSLLSSDTALQSLVVIDEEGAIEHLQPAFHPSRTLYHNVVPLPVHARKVTIVGTARNKHAMVNIVRWDPAADETTRAVVEKLSRVVCTHSHDAQDLSERASIRLQAIARGRIIRAQMVGGGEISARRSKSKRSKSPSRSKSRHSAERTALSIKSGGWDKVRTFVGSHKSRFSAEQRKERARDMWQRAEQCIADSGRAPKGKAKQLEEDSVVGHIGKMVPLAAPAADEMDVCEAAARAIKMSIVANLSTLTTFFLTMDRDHSGTISKAEFLHGMHAMGLTHHSKSEVAALFREMGAEDDGVIDFHEMKHFLLTHARRAPRPEPSLRRIAAPAHMQRPSIPGARTRPS